MKHLGTLHEERGGDGRACAGHGPYLVHLCVHNTTRPNSIHPITVASPMQTIMPVMNRCLHTFRIRNGYDHTAHTHTFRGMLHQLSPATTSTLYMNTASTHGMVSHMHTYTTSHPSYSHTHIIMYTYSINTCMTVYECTHTAYQVCRLANSVNH